MTRRPSAREVSRFAWGGWGKHAAVRVSGWGMAADVWAVGPCVFEIRNRDTGEPLGGRETIRLPDPIPGRPPETIQSAIDSIRARGKLNEAAIVEAYGDRAPPREVLELIEEGDRQHMQMAFADIQEHADRGLKVQQKLKCAAQTGAAPHRDRWPVYQAFVDSEHAHDPSLKWPELKRLAARHFKVDPRTIDRHCTEPRKRR